MPANAIDKKLRVTYKPEIALRICEEVAGGATIVEIEATDGMPSRSTIYRWLAVYPKFFDAYERAREVSAQSFEDEALMMARTLKNANDFTGVKVQAYNIAMQQLRWSASRRDKARYGQQIQGATTVPIQINTTLNLAQDGQPQPTDTQSSIYTVEATVTLGHAETEGYEEDSVEQMVGEGEVLDLSANPDDDEKLPFGLPETETQQLHNPKNGRPFKQHRKGPRKSAGQAARSAKIYAATQARATNKQDTE
jgi:hypothetical protein